MLTVHCVTLCVALYDHHCVTVCVALYGLHCVTLCFVLYGHHCVTLCVALYGHHCVTLCFALYGHHCVTLCFALYGVFASSINTDWILSCNSVICCNKGANKQDKSSIVVLTRSNLGIKNNAYEYNASSTVTN